MSFTDEQIKRWCSCPGYQGRRDQRCPLHTDSIVEWQCFRRDAFLGNEFEPNGVNFVSDEYPEEPYSLWWVLVRAENELESIRRFDELNLAFNCEYELRYRLITEWRRARNA